MPLTPEQIEYIRKKMLNLDLRMFYDDRVELNKPIMDFLKEALKEEDEEEADKIAEQLFGILKEQKETNNTHFELLNMAESLAKPALKLQIIEYRHPETKNATLDEALRYFFKFSSNKDKAANILSALANKKDDPNTDIAQTLLNLLTYKKMNDKELDKTINVLLNAKFPEETQRKIISLLNNTYLCDFQTLMNRDHIRHLITDRIIKTKKADAVTGTDCLLRDWLKTPTNFFAGYKFYAQRAISGNTSSYQKLLAAANPDKKPKHKIK